MLETTCCPDCGAELPTSATGGLCPRCLLGAGITSDSPFEAPGESPFAATTPQAGGFVPPTPASLAGYFPDLDVLEIIGQGGMGAVYKARQTKLDRLVALKIIRPESANDPAFAERFSREAKTLARLNHSSIVSIHDFGELEFSAPGDPDAESVRVTRTLYFFVMEFVDGANLRQLMESGRLQPAQALAIVPQICDALQYAHDEGIVHRDIKPENILIDQRGRVKIADFGLAKLAGQSPEQFTLTGTHQVMGTPRYMAPEQMSGSRQVDHRADLYSLGVVLYEMLTGELPMGRFGAPSEKVAVDARLDDIVHRALATEPDRRYQRASEIRTDMEAIALEAYSQGNVPSVDGSFPSGFPGPSTVMERQVAGVVNWFRGVHPPASAAQQKPEISATDRAAIQRRVRGPAVSLMLMGLIVLVLSLLPLSHATDVQSQLIRESPLTAAGLYFAFAALVFIGALIIRGGWHLLTLDRYRPAVLGGLLGQPAGIWALVQLSRDDVRGAFTADEADDRSLFAQVFQNTTLWGVLTAAGGIAVLFLPWAEILNTAHSSPDAWFSATGFAWSYGMIAGLMLTLVTLVLLSTAALRPVPVWRPLLTAVGAVSVLACCGSFLSAISHRTLAVQPLLEAASWGVELEGGGRVPRTIGDWSEFVVRRLDGPYLMMGFAIGLLIVAAVDFRLALQPHPARRAWRVDVPHFSRKAIVGACWAPLFALAAVALTVTSDVMVHRNANVPEPLPLNILLMIPVGVVTIAGLLAPFGTTILGMLAISDIRQAPGRIHGLGLAYLDAILFPLLVLDVIILVVGGFLLSLLFNERGPTLFFAISVGAPICLVLDAFLAVWGWRHVSRSVGAASDIVAPGSADPAARPSSADGQMPLSPIAPPARPTALTPPPGAAADSTMSSLDLRRIEMQLKAPAAGLMIAGFLNLLFWGTMGFLLFYEAWGMQRGGFHGTTAEVLGASACALVILAVVGSIIRGALNMRGLTDIGWCYAAAILVLIPWAPTSIIGFFIGIWVLNVLGRPEVKEAFVQRSLELEQTA